MGEGSKIDRTMARIARAAHGRDAASRLYAMLHENAGLFAGLSTNDAEWARAHVYAQFETAGLPAAAIPLIREELRTTDSPPIVAAIARALRKAGDIDREWDSLLREAQTRIEGRDEYVSFEFDPDRSHTAAEEVAATLAMIAGKGCCGSTGETAGDQRSGQICRHRAGRIMIEDQDGARTSLADLLANQTTLLAFFYTRCMNPAKCSLTITRLGALTGQGSSAAILAVSYDPGFDSTARLRAYGHDRQFHFGERARMARCVKGWNDMKTLFDLRVGYGEETVNVHARELISIGPDLAWRAIDPNSLATPETLRKAVLAA